MHAGNQVAIIFKSSTRLYFRAVSDLFTKVILSPPTTFSKFWLRVIINDFADHIKELLRQNT